MADVFISYRRDNAARVEPIVRALEAHGLSVWWDRALEHNADFGQVIAREIDGSKAVIVCWSDMAALSEWVRAEADEAKHRGKYIGVLIADGRPPPPFNVVNYTDLKDWKGNADDLRFLGVLVEVGKLTGRSDIASLAASQQRSLEQEEARKRAAAEAARVRAVLDAQRAEEDAAAEEERETKRRTRAARWFFWGQPFIAAIAIWVLGVIFSVGLDALQGAGKFDAAFLAAMASSSWMNAAMSLVIVMLVCLVVRRLFFHQQTSARSYVVPAFVGTALAVLAGVDALGGVSGDAFWFRERQEQAETAETKAKDAQAQLASLAGAYRLRSDDFRFMTGNINPNHAIEGTLTITGGDGDTKQCAMSLEEKFAGRTLSAERACSISVDDKGQLEVVSSGYTPGGMSRPRAFVITRWQAGAMTGHFEIPDAAPSRVVVRLSSGDAAPAAAPPPPPPAPVVEAPPSDQFALAAPPPGSPAQPAPRVNTAPQPAGPASLNDKIPASSGRVATTPLTPRTQNTRPGARVPPPATTPAPVPVTETPAVATAEGGVSGVWRGSYQCAQGTTGVKLTVNDQNGQVSATFEFFPLSNNPNVPTGSAMFAGRYNAGDNTMSLKGVRWISRPEGFSLIEFSGDFDPDLRHFTGTISSPGCGGIALTRQRPAAAESRRR